MIICNCGLFVKSTGSCKYCNGETRKRVDKPKLKEVKLLGCTHTLLFQVSVVPAPGEIVYCIYCDEQRVVAGNAGEKLRSAKTVYRAFCGQCPEHQPKDIGVLYQSIKVAQRNLTLHYETTGHKQLWIARPFDPTKTEHKGEAPY